MDKQDYLVSDVMRDPEATVSPETRVAQPLKLSATKNIHHFPSWVETLPVRHRWERESTLGLRC
jgi:hypothetical protein